MEGIIPGGGVGLLRTLPALDKLKLEGDEKIGVDIIRRSLEEPIRMLAQNAGMEGSVVVQRVKQEKTNVGYDVSQDKYIDLIDAGVIDPTKVTRSALQNASSIAALLLTTECIITEKPEKEEKMPPMPPGGGGYGGMGGY
jgi:chaperonin GroEL